MALLSYRSRPGDSSSCRLGMVHVLRHVSVCLSCGVFVAVAVLGPAHAQSASFRSVDTNRDGVLSFDELRAEFGRSGAERLLRQSDRNNDRTLTIQELRQRSDGDDRSTDRTSGDNDDDDEGGDDNGDRDEGGDDRGGDDRGGDDGGGDDGGGDDD